MNEQKQVVAQLKRAQKSLSDKEYHQARQILAPLDHPKAHEWIEQLNKLEVKRYRKALEVYKAGDKEQAIKMLQHISHPKAAETLKKLGATHNTLGSGIAGELPAETPRPGPGPRRQRPEGQADTGKKPKSGSAAPSTTPVANDSAYEWITDDFQYGFVLDNKVGYYSVDRRNDEIDVNEPYIEITKASGKRVKGRHFYGEEWVDFEGEFVSPDKLHVRLPGINRGALWFKREVTFRYQRSDVEIRLYHPRVSLILLGICWLFAAFLLLPFFTEWNADWLPFLGQSRPVLEIRRGLGLVLFVLPLMYLRVMMPLVRRNWKQVAWRAASITVFILLVPALVSVVVSLVIGLLIITAIGWFFQIMDWNEVDQGIGHEGGRRVRYYTTERGCVNILSGWLLYVVWYIAGFIGGMVFAWFWNLIPSIFPQPVNTRSRQAVA